MRAQARQNELIDWIANRAMGVVNYRNARPFRSDERPVDFISCSFGDPSLQEFLLRLRKSLVRLPRRHDLVGIGGIDAFDESAGVWASWNNRCLTTLVW